MSDRPGRSQHVRERQHRSTAHCCQLDWFGLHASVLIPHNCWLWLLCFDHRLVRRLSRQITLEELKGHKDGALAGDERAMAKRGACGRRHGMTRGRACLMLRMACSATSLRPQSSSRTHWGTGPRAPSPSALPMSVWHAGMALFTAPRLSVQPVSEQHWDFILGLEDQAPAEGQTGKKAGKGRHVKQAEQPDKARKAGKAGKAGKAEQAEEGKQPKKATQQAKEAKHEEEAKQAEQQPSKRRKQAGKQKGEQPG